MAAIFGGTQSLHTNSYDEAVGLPTEQSARVARNTQLICQLETGLTSVADPWGGSYLMESLTDDLCDRAFEILEEVKGRGGMLKAIDSGWAKYCIEESATRMQARSKRLFLRSHDHLRSQKPVYLSVLFLTFPIYTGHHFCTIPKHRKSFSVDTGEDIIVGVNRYCREGEKDEDMKDVLVIDNATVLKEQLAKLDTLRKTRNEKVVTESLLSLTESAKLGSEANTSQGSHPQNLLHLSINAARVGATTGEISLALEEAWGRHVPSSPVVMGAYSDSFQRSSTESEDETKKEYADLREEVNTFAKSEGRHPRILVAKMGQDGHDRGARVIASGFSDLGYDVDVGPLFQTPTEVAQQAIDNDVHVIGISSQAAGHRTLIPELMSELIRMGGKDVLVICGGVIPKCDYDMLYKVGCAAIFGPGTRITDAARDVLRKIPTRNQSD
uniref:methylmalonyl-CoA mutase n=1 Tax=Corethron hystrix TaxID=216773 RepID=A0A7S1FRT9_9STRA